MDTVNTAGLISRPESVTNEIDEYPGKTNNMLFPLPTGFIFNIFKRYIWYHKCKRGNEEVARGGQG